MSAGRTAAPPTPCCAVAAGRPAPPAAAAAAAAATFQARITWCERFLRPLLAAAAAAAACAAAKMEMRREQATLNRLAHAIEQKRFERRNLCARSTLLQNSHFSCTDEPPATRRGGGGGTAGGGGGDARVKTGGEWGGGGAGGDWGWGQQDGNRYPCLSVSIESCPVAGQPDVYFVTYYTISIDIIIQSCITTWIYLFWKFSAQSTYMDAIVTQMMYATWFDLRYKIWFTCMPTWVRVHYWCLK